MQGFANVVLKVEDTIWDEGRAGEDKVNLYLPASDWLNPPDPASQQYISTMLAFVSYLFRVGRLDFNFQAAPLPLKTVQAFCHDEKNNIDAKSIR